MGTVINVVLVLLGAALGLALGDRLPAKVRATALQGLGLAVILIGLRMALQTQSVLILLASLVLGGTLGALLGLEERLEHLVVLLEQHLARRSILALGPARPPADGPSRLLVAFVGSSLVFCVGPMTILGSFQDGLTGDFSTLAIKSLLDFFTAMAFASTLGPGVLLSAATVLLYQGSLTLAAMLLRGTLTEPMMTEMTAAGGLLIVAIGLGLLEVRKLPVVNLLPAVGIAPVLVAWAGPMLSALLSG